MSRRKTHKEFIEEIKAVNGGKYEVISEYKFAREKVRLKCCTCGKVWENTPTHLLRGQACPYCAGEVLKRLKSKVNVTKSRITIARKSKLS